MLPDSIQQLIHHFSKLPGVGPKTAERLVFYWLKQDKKNLADFGNTLLHIKDNIKNCSLCGQITEHNLCSICQNQNRDHSIICVVAESSDITALEKGGKYDGKYHVLHGALSPLDDIGPDELKIRELEDRIQSEGVAEVILATNPNREGEATASYLAQRLKPLGIKVTRIAHGVPVGMDIEYADEVTLGYALSGRKEM